MSIKKKTKSKLPKVDDKLIAKGKQAQKDLEVYFKSNKLDPTKDWSKDKKHGAKVKELLAVINTTRDKVKETAPEEIHHKKADDNKKAKASVASKYDYPLVNGKEMTSGEKKKYRVKMRAEASGKTPKADKAKVAEKAVVKTDKKGSKKEPVVEAKPVKKLKKKSRAHSED